MSSTIYQATDTPAHLKASQIQGYLNMPYKELVERLGSPYLHGMDGIRFYIKIGIGPYQLTIYDKHQSKPKEEIDYWNVGADSPEAYYKLREVLAEDEDTEINQN